MEPTLAEPPSHRVWVDLAFIYLFAASGKFFDEPWNFGSCRYFGQTDANCPAELLT